MDKRLKTTYVGFQSLGILSLIVGTCFIGYSVHRYYANMAQPGFDLDLDGELYSIPIVITCNYIVPIGLIFNGLAYWKVKRLQIYSNISVTVLVSFLWMTIIAVLYGKFVFDILFARIGSISNAVWWL